MSKQKQRGTAFEAACVSYLTDVLAAQPGEIRREVLHGARDEGDIAGVRAHGQSVVIECKSYSGRDRIPQWLREAETERVNAGALAGVVVSKRRGLGDAHTGDQLVTMTLRDFAAIVRGVREWT